MAVGDRFGNIQEHVLHLSLGFTSYLAECGSPERLFNLEIFHNAKKARPDIQYRFHHCNHCNAGYRFYGISGCLLASMIFASVLIPMVGNALH
ncbi:hypothetical protein ACKF11_12265 [Methylobacillus sp. Pita2]|uniref:hypothetical protein n=1 Tax=Methylobacillus sp. Pita2 TaxID=3383245 RepID=UPI0038B6823B